MTDYDELEKLAKEAVGGEEWGTRETDALMSAIRDLRAERDALAKDAGLLREIRRWLNEGATIKATDLAKPVFTLLSDGSFDMGVTVTFPGAALAAQEKS